MPRPPSRNASKPDRAQQVLRPLAVADHEFHGQQIEQALGQPRDAVFRFAELARPMADDDFADAKALGRREHRHEAVQLAVEPNFVHHLAAEGLQAAVVIVQVDARQLAHEPIEHPRRQHLVPGVVALALPAAHDVEAFVELGQQVGDFGRVVLQVAVDA